MVAFDDGSEEELTANAIAPSMYAQVDPADNMYLLFDVIVKKYVIFSGCFVSSLVQTEL